MKKGMKAKVFSVFLMALLAIFLAACTAPVKESVNPEKEQHFKKVRTFESYANFTIIQDVETGCMYLEKEKGITAYYDENGEVMGCFGTSSNNSQ